MLENLSGTNFYDEEASQEADEPEQDNSEELIDATDEAVEEEEAEEGEILEDDEPEEDAVTLSQSEFKELKDQQLMHSDYSKKTMALSADRKETVALNESLNATIRELESLIVGDENSAELDELLEDGDTAEYLRRKKQIDASKAKLKKARGKASESLAATQAEENNKLIELMPEWSDPKVQKADVDAALSYANEIGMSTEELNNMANHKFVRALIDAGRYQKLKKSKPAVSKRKTKPTKKAGVTKKPATNKQKSISELFYGS